MLHAHSFMCVWMICKFVQTLFALLFICRLNSYPQVTDKHTTFTHMYVCMYIRILVCTFVCLIFVIHLIFPLGLRSVRPAP